MEKVNASVLFRRAASVVTLVDVIKEVGVESLVETIRQRAKMLLETTIEDNVPVVCRQGNYRNGEVAYVATVITERSKYDLWITESFIALRVPASDLVNQYIQQHLSHVEVPDMTSVAELFVLSVEGQMRERDIHLSRKPEGGNEAVVEITDCIPDFSANLSKGV